jgi:hypothetical protein
MINMITGHLHIHSETFQVPMKLMLYGLNRQLLFSGDDRDQVEIVGLMRYPLENF